MDGWITGTSFGVFIGITVVIMGFAAYMTGKAVAETWKPIGLLVFYVVLLGIGDRLLTFWLFEGELLSLQGYLIDTLLLLTIALVVHRLTLARQMVEQYPWLYRRAGPFSWREKA